MKLSLSILIFSCTLSTLFAQNMDDLMEAQKEKQAIIADLEAQLEAQNIELAAIESQIKTSAGFQYGINGIIGFDLNRTNNWINSPNPDSRSTSLSLGLTAFANLDKDKYFWNNKLALNQSWQDVDDLSNPNVVDTVGLFDSGIVDILNLSSLGGYKINDKLAVSVQAEWNTSMRNLNEPGTIDFGTGITWIPTSNLTAVVHPFNYHIAFPAMVGPAESQSSLGAKLRIDYFLDLKLGTNPFNWTTTLTSFIPYSNISIPVIDPATEETLFTAGLFNYSWLNTIGFDIWNGIGVGLGFGLRSSQLESDSIQSFYTFGLSFGF